MSLENKKRVELINLIGKAYYEIHHKVKDGEIDELWLKGGRGSLKSSFVAIEIVLGIMRDPEANAIAFRKVGNTVRKSIMETLLWAINMLEVPHLFSRTVAPAEITYLPTGQQIVMTGLDDPLKLKSIKIKKGYFKYVWFEETAEYNGMDEIRNVEQSVMRGGDKFVSFYSYNPPNDPAAWVNVESEIAQPRREVHHSTYLEVDPAWLGKRFIEKAETLKARDYLKYEHEYLGLAVGRAEQIIFHGKWKEKEFETPPLDRIYQSKLFYGADWGFANDPTAVTRSFILVEGGERNLYIEYEAGGSGIEIDELPKIFDTIPDIKRWKTYGDCSRPETNSYMSNRGYNVAGSPKWTGCEEDGVEYMRSFNNIFIHPRCKQTIEEFKRYSYKVDKNTQEILPVIVDKWNHYIDSVRYALSDYITREVSILDVL
jgi:PBSX family phage terminase large subunit